MVGDWFELGGAGGIGGALTGILAVLGFRKRLDSLEGKVVYRDTCAATVQGLRDAMGTQTEIMKEMRNDIKEILRHNGGGERK